MPLTLHEEIELEAVTEIIDLMAGHTLNKDQSDSLETLAKLAEAYESCVICIPWIHLEERGDLLGDVPIIGRHIQRLCGHGAGK